MMRRWGDFPSMALLLDKGRARLGRFESASSGPLAPQRSRVNSPQ